MGQNISAHKKSASWVYPKWVKKNALARRANKKKNSGGYWDPRSKKKFGLQENVQPIFRTFVKNPVYCCESLAIEKAI